MPIRHSDGRTGGANPTSQLTMARRVLAAARERFGLHEQSNYDLHLLLDGETVPSTDIEGMHIDEVSGQAHLRLTSGRVIVLAAGTLLAAAAGARFYIRHRT